MEIELKLTVDEAAAIMQIMGQMPTGSGIYPLMVKIKEQAESQIEEGDKDGD